ncbi:hypothetical protein H8D36_02020 [archaeon]|nr:hypothetical protein [archaeon]
MNPLGKLKFWKKKDDLGLADPLANEPGMDFHDPMGNFEDSSMNFKDNLGLEPEPQGDLLGSGSPDMPRSLRDKSTFDNFNSQQVQPAPAANREFELISSKLDTIKAELDSMNQRLQKIEKIAEQEHEKKPAW